MNARDLSMILQTDTYARRYFRGVYPRNRLPRFFHRPCALIVNTDKFGGPGEHWVAIWLDRNGQGEYFDSFGAPPVFEEVEKFLKSNCTNYNYNRIMYQDVTSAMCGVYVLYYILMKSRGVRMSRMTRLLHSRFPLRNDRLVWIMTQQITGLRQFRGAV